MTRKLLFMQVILAGILMLGACNEIQHNDLPPKIEFIEKSALISSDTTLSFGEMSTFGIRLIKTDNNITNFIIKQDTGEGFVSVFDTGMNTNGIDIYFEFIKSVAEKEIFKFIARDIEGNQNSLSLIISKDTILLLEAIKSLKNIVLNAQNHPTGESFYSLSMERKFDLENAYKLQDSIDLCYYYYGTDENVIASPGANIEAGVFVGSFELDNWNSRNTTRFKPANISTSKFNEITNDSLLLVAYGSSDGKRKAKNLKANDIYAFKTEKSKIGLFCVKSIDAKDEGSITLDIKIQK